MRRLVAGSSQSGFLAEPDTLRLEKGFLIISMLFGVFHSEPNRIDNEFAVWALSTLVNDHFRPAGLEVHVLADFEFRFGGSREDLFRGDFFHRPHAHVGLTPSTIALVSPLTRLPCPE
jgi:hypothetical protein